MACNDTIIETSSSIPYFQSSSLILSPTPTFINNSRIMLEQSSNNLVDSLLEVTRSGPSVISSSSDSVVSPDLQAASTTQMSFNSPTGLPPCDNLPTIR